MKFKKSKRVYDLEYIEKLFRIIPLSFIIILTLLSILITYFILQSKQKRDTDLLLQDKKIHFEFKQKERLQNFYSQIKKNVSIEFDKEKTKLAKNSHRIIGNLDGLLTQQRSKKQIQEFLENYEERHDIKITLFEKKSLDIWHGDENINYLQKLIFGQISDDYKKVVLQYIYSQGSNNIQYWKNDVQATSRLSFFDSIQINDKEYYIGSFSKVVNLKFLTKNVIVESIKNLKDSSSFDIWFMDVSSKESFNYFSNHIHRHPSEINENKSKKYEILKYYKNNVFENSSFSKNVYFNSLFYYILVIDYKTDYTLNTLDIEKKYNQLFITIVAYVLFISTILILFSFLFSSFIKNILDNYNKKLQDRTNSLQHWKNRFELAVIASNDGLWDINFTTNTIYFSEKWLEISGYDKGEIQTFSDWFNLIHNEDKKSVELIFEKIFAQKSDTFMSEYRLKTKNSGYKWILARGRVFIDKQSNEQRMLMMSMDIDKSKRMKKELLDVELLVEDGKIVIFKLNNDKQFSVKFISNSIKNYGFTKEEFENKKLSFINLIYEEDLDIVRVAINAALKKDLPDFTFVCRAKNAANEIKWISCRTILIKNHSGEVIYFYGYINDITKIKVSEEDLKLEVANEVEKNREKDRLLIQQSKLAAMGELIGSIAHQWRQPLNLVFLFLQFLKDNYKNKDIDDSMIEKYFKRSYTQIEYMSQTIDDFRNFYKPSKLPTIFYLNDALSSTYKIIKVQLEEENIQVDILNEENIQISTYENELKQSFLNIFNNAKDAIISRKKEETFEAKIKIEIKKTDDEVSITIFNNGAHIPEDILPRIFEPYFTTKFETQGTGIGLYMTKTIIETNMKGKIHVENIKDGVIFQIKLPSNIGKKNG